MAELIILILFMLFAALSRFLESRRAQEMEGKGQPDQPTQPRPRRPHWAEDDGPAAVDEDPLSEALRQIRDALGQPSPQPEPAEAPVAAEPPRPMVDDRAPDHSPEVAARIAEMGGESSLRHTTQTLQVENVTGLRSLSPLGRELQDPAAARRAVIMKEVLDAPPSRRYRMVRSM